MFRPLFVEGDYVEVKIDEEWQLGFIVKMHFRGYIEYDIRLLSSGRVVEAQAPIMRKTDHIPKAVHREDDPEVVLSSQPESDSSTDIPMGFRRISSSTISSNAKGMSQGNVSQSSTFTVTLATEAGGTQPLDSSFKQPLHSAKPSTATKRSSSTSSVQKSPILPKISSHRSNPLSVSPGRDIIIPSPAKQRNITPAASLSSPYYIRTPLSAQLRPRPVRLPSPPPVKRIVRAQPSPYPSPFSLAKAQQKPKTTTSSSENTLGISSKEGQSTSHRFPQVSAEEIANIQMNSKSANTLRNTAWGVGVLREWLQSKSLEVDFENLRTEVLADYLVRFYAAARNKDGEMYSKSSLHCIRGAIQRHLTLPPHNLNISIINGVEFKAANNVISGTLRSMKETGQDRSRPHPPISPEDMLKMYKTGALSISTPRFLQWKVFFEVTLHFGRRGREGLRLLQKNHIVFKKDGEGTEYATLDFNSLEKNHQGLDIREQEHIQRMYATGLSNCPVASLKLYLARLHPMCIWFFQRPKVIKFLDSDIWYYNAPVGVNTIANFMPSISSFAQTSRRYTNHCIRATTITTLRELRVAYEDIKAVTGHKSTASIDHYSKTTDSTRKSMSKKLSSALGTSPKPYVSPRRSHDQSTVLEGVNIPAAADIVLKHPVPSDTVHTQPYSSEGEKAPRRRRSSRKSKKTHVKKAVEEKKKAEVRRKLRANVQYVLSQDDDISTSTSKESPVKSQARKIMESRWKKKNITVSSSSSDISDPSEESKEESPISSDLFSSQDEDNEDSTDKKDDDNAKGPSSLFKGCKIAKIKIVYK